MAWIVILYAQTLSLFDPEGAPETVVMQWLSLERRLSDMSSNESSVPHEIRSVLITSGNKMNDLNPLYGWDDGKIYLRDETGKEWWGTGEEELYNRLVEMCREYFEGKSVTFMRNIDKTDG